MKQCVCGAPLPDGALFCGRCGRPAEGETSASGAPASPDRDPSPADTAAAAPKRPGKKRLGIILAAALALLAAALTLIFTVIVPSCAGSAPSPAGDWELVSGRFTAADRVFDRCAVTFTGDGAFRLYVGEDYTTPDSLVRGTFTAGGKTLRLRGEDFDSTYALTLAGDSLTLVTDAGEAVFRRMPPAPDTVPDFDESILEEVRSLPGYRDRSLTPVSRSDTGRIYRYETEEKYPYCTVIWTNTFAVSREHTPAGDRWVGRAGLYPERRIEWDLLGTWTGRKIYNDEDAGLVLHILSFSPAPGDGAYTLRAEAAFRDADGTVGPFRHYAMTMTTHGFQLQGEAGSPTDDAYLALTVCDDRIRAVCSLRSPAGYAEGYLTRSEGP